MGFTRLSEDIIRAILGKHYRAPLNAFDKILSSAIGLWIASSFRLMLKFLTQGVPLQPGISL